MACAASTDQTQIGISQARALVSMTRAASTDQTQIGISQARALVFMTRAASTNQTQIGISQARALVFMTRAASTDQTLGLPPHPSCHLVSASLKGDASSTRTSGPLNKANHFKRSHTHYSKAVEMPQV